MPLDHTNLTSYDNVVAVTQKAINQTLGEYLQMHPLKFALYAKDDGNGGVVMMPSEDGADFCFSGVLALEKDDRGNWINLVKLNADKGTRTVQYNVTLRSGEFKVSPSIHIKQTDRTPWVFSFFVKLVMKGCLKSELPLETQQALSHVDENIFSIQQLYMDLNTAAFASRSGERMPLLVESIAVALMREYLKQQQAEGKPLFGVTVQFKDSKTPPPTLTPTFVDFCVTLYRDPKTNQFNPDLDTLNYLVMTDNRAPPMSTPSESPLIYMADPSTHGAMAIRREVFSSFVIKRISPLLKLLCPVMFCKADGEKVSPENLVIRLEPGTEHVFEPTYDANTGRIATFEHNTHDTSTDIGPVYANYRYQVSANYKSLTCISLRDDKIEIAGSITVSASTSFQVKANTSRTDMPNTKYNWSVELQLYMDATNNGQLRLKVVNPDFSRLPEVEQHDSVWWKDFLARIGGYMRSYTDSLGNLRSQVQGEIERRITPELELILSRSNHFVFPGGRTFAFKNPGFSRGRNLVSEITYLNPNA